MTNIEAKLILLAAAENLSILGDQSTAKSLAETSAHYDHIVNLARAVVDVVTSGRDDVLLKVAKLKEALK